MENMTEYQKNLVRMWDSIRTDDDNKGKLTCAGTLCIECPLEKVCSTDVKCPGRWRNAEKAIEIVTQWAKEHPFVTNEQKFKEDWGCEPKSIGGIYLCPSYFGFEECESPFGQSATNPSCIEREKKYWQSEYKPPKADKEGVKNE